MNSVSNDTQQKNEKNKKERFVRKKQMSLNKAAGSVNYSNAGLIYLVKWFDDTWLNAFV